MGSMKRDELDWQYRSGRDHEGDSFSVHLLVHGSGRILAKVFCPVAAGEFQCRVQFYCKIPKTILANPEECFDFIEDAAAMRFAESVLLKFDPFAAESKPARKPRKKVAA